MYPHWAAIWILCLSSTQALSLPSLEEDRTVLPLRSRQALTETPRDPLKVSSDCLNLTGPPEAKCYFQYLIGWPLTTPGLSCGIGDTWAECFIRDATTQNGFRCTQLDGSCNNITNLPLNGALLPDEVYYANYTIATMQNVYTLLAKMANVTKDVDRLDPVLTKLRTNPLNLTNPGDVDFENYQMALTLGIPYLAYQQLDPSTRRMGKYPISDGLYEVAYDFALIGLRRSPAMIEVMWPSDGSTLTNTDYVFEAGVANLFTNLQRFVAFTRLGTFNESLERELSFTIGISLAAATLHTTTRLLQNGFIVIPDPVPIDNSSLLILPGREPEECTELIDIRDGENFDYGRICDALDGSTAGARYWSPATKRLYNFGLNITSPLGKATLAAGTTNAKQVLLDIWNEGYADLNLMFDGGYECQVNGFFGALLRVASDGQMDFNCFSSLPMDLRNVRQPLSVTTLSTTSDTALKLLKNPNKQIMKVESLG
ncbi:MAG: hypothetical protein Q9204_005882 [Flavoplaca sp. TL-2023a]